LYGEDSGHYVWCTQHSCQRSLMLECAYFQIASDHGWWMPTFRQCSWICEMRTADSVTSLHMAEPSSCYLLTQWWTAFRNWASSQFISQWNQHWVSTMEPIWIKSSTARSLTPQLFKSTNAEGQCFS
jgi:hypothetical protein